MIDTDELYAMILAWNSGSATQRAVALELADRNLRRSKSVAYLSINVKDEKNGTR